MPYHFFPMIARMRYISRWGLMRNTDPENVQEHSHMVAVLAHALAVIENERFSGQTDLRPAYDEAITIPDPHVRDLVKAADKLSAYLKCLEELKAGNTEFRKAKEQTYAALLQNPLPALRCFMEEFLPGFELTLDELS